MKGVRKGELVRVLEEMDGDFEKLALAEGGGEEARHLAEIRVGEVTGGDPSGGGEVEEGGEDGE